MRFTLLRLANSAIILTVGLVLGRYAFPAAATKESVRNVDSTRSGPAEASAEKSAGPDSFAGDIEDLLRMARAIREHLPLAETLHRVLSLLPAEKLAELSADFSWDEPMAWQDAAVCQVILENWIARNPDAAKEWAATLSGPRGSKVLEELLATTARSEPGKAVAWARRIDVYGDGALPELAALLANTDPRAALKILQTGADPTSEDRYDEVFKMWAAREPAAAFAAAMALPKDEARDNALRKVYSEWAILDRPAAYKSALAQPRGTQRNNAVAEVLRSWASNEPKGAYAAAQSLPADERRAALSVVLGAWAGSDPASVAGIAGTIPQADRKDVNKVIAQTWMHSDPHAAVAWLKTLSEKEGGDDIARDLLSDLAKKDGPAAAAAWNDLSFRQRKAALFSVVSEWSARDLEGALQWARALEQPLERANAISGCMANLDFSQMDRVQSLLSELGDGEARQSAIVVMVARQSSRDANGTLAFLGFVDESERAAALAHYGIIDALSKQNVRGTLDLLTSTPSLARNSSTAPTSFDWQDAVKRLADDNPAEALNWANALSDPVALKNGLEAVLDTWAQKDAAEAMRQARTIEDAELQNELIRSVIYEWGEQDPDGILKWSETATGDERGEAILRAGLGKSDKDPAAGAAIVDSFFKEYNNAGKDSPYSLWIASAVARQWVAEDAKAAGEWVLRLPPGDIRNDAVKDMVQEWTGIDPMAASRWVQALPQGSERDTAAARLSESVTASDPGSAFTWAASISDEKLRDATIARIAQSALESGLEATRAAVEQAPISEERKTEIMQALRKE